MLRVKFIRLLFSGYQSMVAERFFLLKSLNPDDNVQVQELQPLHKGRDETDQRRLIDEEVNFVDDQTATTSRTLGITRY